VQCGVVLPTYGPAASPPLIRQAAELAEGLGYASIWTTDHIMVPKGAASPYGSIYEAVTTLTWAAALTSGVALGISVLVMPLRSPVIVAKEVATLDRLSDGRVILGVGAGYVEPEFAFLSADFTRRGAAVEEGVAVVRALWSGNGAPFSGRSLTFSDHSFSPLPRRPGGPPIWVGGASPAALRRAAKIGDAWHGSMLSPGEFEALAARVRALTAGREVAVTLRATVGERRGWMETSRGQRYVLGEGKEELITDVEAYRDAGCAHLILNLWDGDPERYLERLRRIAVGVVQRL
jgi:probable F420-dependent oxidoreductase